MRILSIGKIRGLQQITTDRGTFIISAIDHRGSIRSMISPDEPENVTYAQIVERKQELCSILSPYVSATLLDPEFSAAQCIAGGKISGHIGLLVSIESTGYEISPQGRITHVLDKWSVDKIKRMGASAVKILLYYRPDMPNVAARQLDTIRGIAMDCIKHDIPFLVEPVTYPSTPGVAEPAELRSRLVIETARQLTKLPIDVLKAELPGDVAHEHDEGNLIGLCRELDAASQVPWVVLSAGADFETFAKQVEIACKSGASGFLGGRAIWQESTTMSDREQRLQFLSTTVVERIKKLADIVNTYAVPWYSKYGLKPDGLSPITMDWYKEY